MQVFRNKQTHKQTTQAIVIVLLNDASLRRLWKRANPEKSFKTWYQTWGVSPFLLICRVPARTLTPKPDEQKWPVVYMLARPSGVEVQRTWTTWIQLPQMWPGQRAPSGWEGGSLQRNRTSQPRSAQLKQTSSFLFYFFCSFEFLQKTLMIKKKMFLVFKEMYPMWPINSAQTHTGTTPPPATAWFPTTFPVRYSSKTVRLSCPSTPQASYSWSLWCTPLQQ